MLDLVVLGMVPGTHFVITLWWALAFALAFWIVVLVWIEMTKPVKAQKHSHPEVDLGTITIPNLWASNIIRPDQSAWIRKSLNLE